MELKGNSRTYSSDVYILMSRDEGLAKTEELGWATQREGKGQTTNVFSQK